MAEVAVRCELMALQLQYIRVSLDMPSPNREFNLRTTDIMITITEMRLNSMMELSKLKNQQSSKQQLIKEVGVMEEMKSEEGDATNSTRVSNLICDSNSQTLIPDNVGSQMFKSISRGIEDESLDFEVVPSFLFEEKEHSVNSEPQEENSLTTRSNSFDVLRFQSEGVEGKMVRDFIGRNQGIIDEKYSRYSKEFFILDNKVNSMNYFYLHLDDVRSLFDRGKYAIVLSISYENLVNIWIPSFGYHSYFQYINLIVSSCVISVEIHGEKKAFVQMSDRGKLVLARIVSLEMACQLLAQRLERWRESILILKLRCGLSQEITVLHLDSWDSLQIPLESMQRVFKFLSFDMLPNILLGSFEFEVLQPWVHFYYMFWFCEDHGTCFCRRLKVTYIPATRLYAYVIQFLNSAGNFVLFLRYFCMRTSTIIGDSFRLLRMEFFLQYPFPASANYGSDTTQGKGMQLYRYPTGLRSMYCVVLRCYGFYRLPSLVYQTREGYIKLEFYVEAVGSQTWFTGNYTPYVLLVVTPLSCELVVAILWSVGILLTQLWYLRFSPAMHSSWTVSLVIGVNLLVWTDAHTLLNFLKYMVHERFSISAKVAYYVGKHCNTRSRDFKKDYFDMLLRLFPPCTIDFTKVYFLIHIILSTSVCVSLPTSEYFRLIFDRGRGIEHVERSSPFDTNTCYLFVSNGLIFMDACDDKYAHEFILKLGYHLLLLLRISNMFEFAIEGNRCDASMMVNEKPQTYYILGSTLILHMARKNEFGSASELYAQLFITFTSLDQMIKDGKEFVKMVIPSKVSAMLFVCLLIIQMESNLLFFSSEFDFTVFSFGL